MARIFQIRVSSLPGVGSHSDIALRSHCSCNRSSRGLSDRPSTLPPTCSVFVSSTITSTSGRSSFSGGEEAVVAPGAGLGSG